MDCPGLVPPPPPLPPSLPRLSSFSAVGVERGGNTKEQVFMSSSRQGLALERFERESLAGAERSHLVGGSVLSGRTGCLSLRQQLTTQEHTWCSFLSEEKSQKSLLGNLSRHRGS